MKHIAFLWCAALLICMGGMGCLSSVQDIILDDTLYPLAARDPLTITEVRLCKDILCINISYGGGCEDHNFSLVASSFMESQPVKVDVVLSHEDHDDPCDMWITEELLFHLGPLKQSWRQSYHSFSGVIEIHLEGWDTPVLYQF